MDAGEAEVAGPYCFIDSGADKFALKEDHVLAALTDFSKAYDRVCRETLWRCWRGVWCEEKISIEATGFMPCSKIQWRQR